jgi:hypothetical protein
VYLCSLFQHGDSTILNGFEEQNRNDKARYINQGLNQGINNWNRNQGKNQNEKPRDNAKNTASQP